MLSSLLPLIVGSALGGSSRFFLAGAVNRSLTTGGPIGTLAVNLLGCFLIGALDAVAISRGLSEHTKAFLVVGFCGAFTTFSAFALETMGLLREGRWPIAVFNALGSVFLGLFCFYLGDKLTRWVLQ